MRHRYFPLVVAALGVMLTLGSLRVGWRMDDYYQRWIILGSPVWSDVGRKPIDAFTFCDGDLRRNQRMLDIGMLAWWNDPHIKAAFWKPITVLTHMLDYRLWPDRPALMHGHSIVWFALWILSACLVYRRLMGLTLAAALAGLLYAVAHSRAVPVAWLANRNAVLAAVFGFLAIYAHDRWRRDRRRAFGVLSPILMGMSLLSAEAGLGAAGYLIAYAVTIDPARWRRGLLHLWPHLLVIIAWRIAWSAQGYGVYAVETLYTDPGAHPLRFALNVLGRAPLYLLNQWTSIPAEIHWYVPPRVARVMCWFGALITAILFLVFLPLFRRSRAARFWGLGMLLATIPMCSAAPMNRHLAFIGLGAMGLLGQFFASSLRRQFWRRSLIWRAGVGTLIVLLTLIHLVIAPIALALHARYPGGPPKQMDQFHIVPSDPQSNRDLIFVNHPMPMDILYFLCARAVDHEPLPRSAQVLGPAWTPLLITRTDDRSLLVRPDFSSASKRRSYAGQNLPAQGQVISLPSMRITIVEMAPDTRSAAVLFEFNVPLEDASLQWVYWESGAFREFQPPAVGEEIRLAGG